MNKKNILIFSVIALWFFIPSIFYTFSNLILESNSILIASLWDFLEKQDNFLAWNFYYKIWDYEKAKHIYESIECENKDNCQKLFNNLWNTYFKLSEETDDNYLKLSIQNYEKSLTYRLNSVTEENLKYVKNVLNNLEKKFQEKELQDENYEDNLELEDNSKENKEQEEKSDFKDEMNSVSLEEIQNYQEHLKSQREADMWVKFWEKSWKKIYFDDNFNW